MSHHQPRNVVEPSDHGGQYVLTIEYGHCSHGRDARPEMFEHAEWETPLAAVLQRLRPSGAVDAEQPPRYPEDDA
jgi:hypothetical protein